MRRRVCLILLASPLVWAAESARTGVRGKLGRDPGGRPALGAAGGKWTRLDGDDPTAAVLNDERIAAVDLETFGRFAQDGAFTIDPIHTKAMFVHKDGRRLFITYWCDVCAIRTYSPGKCWCCQEETELDLRERYDQ